MAAQKRKIASKKQSVDGEREDGGYGEKRPQRHGVCKHLEQARDKARRMNKEHLFYRTALQCQMPQEIRSKMLHGFKVS